MRILNKILMTLAGLLLIVAAGLKFYEMVDTCVPSWDAKAAAAVATARQTGESIPQWKANLQGFWESYEFFLIQIPLEFALGVWLVSGLFRKAAWLAGTLAYLGFIGVTLTKAMLGFESCGCFGQIHVNPWITLFAIDIPLFLLLAIFRPKGIKLLPPPWPNLAYLLAVFVPTIALMVVAPAALVALRPDCIEVGDQPDETAPLKLKIFKLNQELTARQQDIDDLNKAVEELRKTPRTTDKKAFIGVLEVIAAEKPNFYEIHIGGKQTLILNAENLEKIYLSVRDMGSQKFTVTETGQVEMNWIKPEPAVVDPPVVDTTDTPPVVEEWEWLQYVVEDDVRQQVSKGLVVVMMYHHDCPTCADMAPRYSNYYKEMTEQGNDAFNIAFLAVPPYGDEGPVPEDTTCIHGVLTDQQNWQVMSPYVVALLDGERVKQWEQGTAPEPENLLSEIFGD